MIAPLSGCGDGCHRHPHTEGATTTEKEVNMNATSIAAIRHGASHTNLICMCCGHIQPVSRDQLPSRCECCREPFAGHGYLLDDTSDAERLSQEVLGSHSISHANGALI